MCIKAENTKSNNTVLSGIQPTGQLHLGNYLGAIKNWINLQNDEQYDKCIYSIVDQHAITVYQNPKELADTKIEIAATIFATGIDSKKSILFFQSSNPHHTELAWYFNCIARMGWLNRMTQFKDKSGKNKENASVGLFTYPILQAADILIYKASHVPVGDDQIQHLELCRDIAKKFNNDYKTDFFPLVQPVLNKNTARIMALNNAQNKMSKSDKSPLSRINILDSDEEIAKKIKKAKSDNELLPDNINDLDNREELKNLLRIYSGLIEQDLEKSINDTKNMNWKNFKNLLCDVCVDKISTIRNEIIKLKNDKNEIQKILNINAEKAQELSSPILKKTKKIMGII